jgi:hypothetical protein
MPKIRKPPPAGVLAHLVARYREGRISVREFAALKHWLESDPDVPAGKWFKRFPSFILAGEGDLPKTFLTSGMVPSGEEVE